MKTGSLWDSVTRAARSIAQLLAGALPDFRDLHVYGGALLMAAGVWTWSRPAALILLGAVFFFLGLRGRHGMAP